MSKPHENSARPPRDAKGRFESKKHGMHESSDADKSVAVEKSPGKMACSLKNREK